MSQRNVDTWATAILGVVVSLILFVLTQSDLVIKQVSVISIIFLTSLLFVVLPFRIFSLGVRAKVCIAALMFLTLSIVSRWLILRTAISTEVAVGEQVTRLPPLKTISLVFPLPSNDTIRDEVHSEFPSPAPKAPKGLVLVVRNAGNRFLTAFRLHLKVYYERRADPVVWTHQALPDELIVSNCPSVPGEPRQCDRVHFNPGESFKAVIVNEGPTWAAIDIPAGGTSDATVEVHGREDVIEKLDVDGPDIHSDFHWVILPPYASAEPENISSPHPVAAPKNSATLKPLGLTRFRGQLDRSPDRVAEKGVPCQGNASSIPRSTSKKLCAA